MTGWHAWAAVAGWGSDRVFGEPPNSLHPVVWFGKAMTAVEDALYYPTRSRGVAHCATGIALGVGVAGLVQRIAGRSAAAVLLASLTMAGRMLEVESLRVAESLEAGDLAQARLRLSGLVGRNTEDLSENEVARAVVETLAENTVDAVTATMFWVTIAGPVGAAAHRCANTMDAMVGHRSSTYEAYGWASARLDDAANWLPARLTAGAVMACEPGQSRDVVRVVRRDAKQHPSPNGGVVEAAFAAALGIQLGGANSYHGRIEDRGVLGDGRAARPGDIRQAARLARNASVAFALGCGAAVRAVSWLRAS